MSKKETKPQRYELTEIATQTEKVIKDNKNENDDPMTMDVALVEILNKLDVLVKAVE